MVLLKPETVESVLKKDSSEIIGDLPCVSFNEDEKLLEQYKIFVIPGYPY